MIVVLTLVGLIPNLTEPLLIHKKLQHDMVQNHNCGYVSGEQSGAIGSLASITAMLD